MDPVTIISLLAAAAGALGSEAVKDLHEAAKQGIKDLFGEEADLLEALDDVEEKPQSKNRRNVSGGLSIFFTLNSVCSGLCSSVELAGIYPLFVTPAAFRLRLSGMTEKMINVESDGEEGFPIKNVGNDGEDDFCSRTSFVGMTM